MNNKYNSASNHFIVLLQKFPLIIYLLHKKCHENKLSELQRK
jgi:hypothetical protein